MKPARSNAARHGAVHAMALVLTGAAGMLALTGLAIRKAQVARAQLNAEVVQTRHHARSAMELALQRIQSNPMLLGAVAQDGGTVIGSMEVSGAEISAILVVEQQDGEIIAETPPAQSGGGGLLGGLLGGVVGGTIDLLTPDSDDDEDADRTRHYLVVASESVGARQIARVELDIDIWRYPSMVDDSRPPDYWPLSESQNSNIAVNARSATNPGTYFGFGTAGAITAPDGKPAPRFTTSTTAVVVQTDALQAYLGTVMCWFQSEPQNGSRTMFRAVGSKRDAFEISLLNSDRIRVVNAGRSGNQSIAPGSMDLSGWRHLALVMESQTWRFYIDGVQVGSESIRSDYLEPAMQFHIGGAFSGSVRDFSVHSTALSSATVAEFASQRIRPTTLEVIPGSFARITE